MYKSATNYGIVLISGKEFRCYSVCLTGKNHIDAKLLAKISEELQKKQKKGGQSAQRIDRLRQIKRDNFVSRMADKIVEVYTTDNHTKYTVDGLIIAGPSNTKTEVIKEQIFQQYFSNKILKTTDCKEIDDTTIKTLCKENKSLFEAGAQKQGLKLMEEIKLLITKDADMLVFGEKEVISGLEKKLLKKVLHDDNINFTTYINKSKCEFVKLSGDELKDYSNCIGIKYFSQASEIINET